jgi:hypothetical protein
MTAVIILNVVFCAFVVVGILALLGWGILTDRATAVTGYSRRRRTVAPVRARRAPKRALRTAFDS